VLFQRYPSRKQADGSLKYPAVRARPRTDPTYLEDIPLASLRTVVGRGPWSRLLLPVEFVSSDLCCPMSIFYRALYVHEIQLTSELSTQRTNEAEARYRCPFCPPSKLTSPLLRMLMKMKQYTHRGLLNHLRRYHPECDIGSLPPAVRERARTLQSRWREKAKRL
jgi:hypothetical protein